MLDVEMTPSATDVATWVDEVVAGTHSPDGQIFSTIRTGALFPTAVAGFVNNGFVEVDRLALLERLLLDPAVRRLRAPDGTSVIRLRDRGFAAAASVDASSFGDSWANDAQSLAEIADATPQWRGSIVVDAEHRPRWGAHIDPAEALGFSITGRAGHTGYLQRLAVNPAARRRGIGRHLVEDSCGWLTQRGATRVLVNTGVDNHGALALYEQCNFTVSPNELVVLELDISGHRSPNHPPAP